MSRHRRSPASKRRRKQQINKDSARKSSKDRQKPEKKSINHLEKQILASEQRRKNKKRAQKKEKLVKKRRRRFLIFILLFLGLLIFALYQIIDYLFLTDYLDELPVIRKEANQSIQDTLLVTDTSNRSLTQAEKEEDLSQVLTYMDRVPKVNAPAKTEDAYEQNLQVLVDQARESTSDEAFIESLDEILVLLGDPQSKLVREDDYRRLLQEEGHDFYEAGSTYSRVLNLDRVEKRYGSKDSNEGSAQGINIPPPQLNFYKDGRVAVLSELNFTGQGGIAHGPLMEDIFQEANTASNLIIDLRGLSGFSNSYWVENILPYISEGNNGASTYLYFPQGFNRYMDYLSIQEQMIEFDIQDDREPISMLIPQDVQEEVADLDFQKEMTLSSLRSEKNQITSNVFLLIDENTGGAAESFAEFCKLNNIGQIAGQTSSGTGWTVPPFLIPLKHSGLIIQLNVAVPLNTDQTNLQKYTGLKPHIVLGGDDLLEALLYDLP